MSLRIVSNQVRCLKCGDEPFSANRHDFKHCACGAVAVDGGTEYLRRVWNEGAVYEDISIQMPDEAVKAAIAAVDWAKDTNRNSLGIAYAVMRALRDHGQLRERPKGEDIRAEDEIEKLSADQ